MSFVEIFMQKGVAALTDGGWGEAGYRWGTMLFFGGMIITALLDVVVHVVSNINGMKASKNATNVTEIRMSPPVQASESGDSGKVTADAVTPEQLEDGKAGSVQADVESEKSAEEVQSVDHVRHLSSCPPQLDSMQPRLAMHACWHRHKLALCCASTLVVCRWQRCRHATQKG